MVILMQSFCLLCFDSLSHFEDDPYCEFLLFCEIPESKVGNPVAEVVTEQDIIEYFDNAYDFLLENLSDNLPNATQWKFSFQSIDGEGIDEFLMDSEHKILNDYFVVRVQESTVPKVVITLFTENDNSFYAVSAAQKDNFLTGFRLQYSVDSTLIFHRDDGKFECSPDAIGNLKLDLEMDGEESVLTIKRNKYICRGEYFPNRNGHFNNRQIDEASTTPPKVVIALFTEHDNSFYAVSAAQKDNFLSGFRLQYGVESTLIFHRDDGKFECSPDAIGQLKLDLEMDGEESVMTIKRNKYICRGEYFPNRNGRINKQKINQIIDLPTVPLHTVRTIADPVIINDNHIVLPPDVPSTFISTPILEDSQREPINSTFPSTAKASSIKVLTEIDTVSTSSKNNRSSFPEVINTKSLANFNAKIEILPNCAERSLLELYLYFVLEKVSDIPQDQIKGSLVTLRSQLEKEHINNPQISKSLQLLENNLTSLTKDQIAKLLLQCLNDLQVIDSDLLIDLLQKTLRAAANIEYKDIILLLGNTGAGKSTTIHFLCGSTFCLEDNDDGYQHLKVVSSHPQLNSFITSSNPNSETFNINAIDLEFENIRFTLCDTPGFKDNRGVEVDIANGIGVATAVRGCRSVRPLILISSRTLGERLDGIAEILRTPIDFISSIEQHLPSLSYCFTKFNLSDFKGNNRLFRQINSKLTAMKASGNADDTVVTVFQDLLYKIEAKGGIANVLDPEHDNREEFVRHLLSTEPIQNPSEVFNDFANPESLNLLKIQLSKHKTSVDASLEHQNYALLNYKLKQLKIFYDCLQITDCKIYYEDSVKKVETYAENLLTTIFDKIEKIQPDANNYIDSDVRECANCICHLYSLDDIRAQHFPRLTSFHSTCLTRISRFQKDLTSCLFSQNLDFLDKEIIDYFKNNEVKIRIEKLRLVCHTFIEVFTSYNTTTTTITTTISTDSVDSNELLTELQKVYQDVCSIIRSNIQNIIGTFHESVANGLFEKSLQLLDSAKILLHLFELPIKDISDNSINPECYHTMRNSLEKLIYDRYIQMKELLEKTTCLLLSSEELSDIGGFVSIINIFKNYESAMSHFDQLRMADFDEFLNILRLRIMATKQMITQEFLDNDDDPFTVIRTCILPVIKLRQIPLLFDFTMEAYSILTDELQRLLSALSSEISSIMEWLENEKWDMIPFPTFETKLRKLSDGKALVDLPDMIHHSYFQEVMKRLEDCFMAFQKNHQITPINCHKPRMLISYMQSYMFFQSCSHLCEIQSISELPSLCNLITKINEDFQCILSQELQRIRSSLPTTKEIIQIDKYGDNDSDDSRSTSNGSQMEQYSLTWANTHLLWVLKALQFKEAECIIGEFAPAYVTYYNRISDNLTKLFDEIIKEDSTIILPEKMELKKQMVAELHKYLLEMREFRNAFKQLLARDHSDECISLQNIIIEYQQLNQFRLDVFSLELGNVLDCWLEANDENRIIKHLFEYLNYSDFSDFDTLERKYTISSMLCPIDHFYNNATNLSVQGSYAIAKEQFLSHLKKLQDTVSIYIRNEDYGKVREMFTTREPASKFINELTSSIDMKIESLIQKTDKMKITVTTLNSIEPTIKELHSLQRASELILEFLLEPVKSKMNLILTIQYKILSALNIFFSGIDNAIDRWDFVTVESIIQSTHWALCFMFGSIENYNAFKNSNNIPSITPIDITEKYSKMEDSIRFIIKAYDESFRDICTYFKLDASQDVPNEVMVIPTGEGMMTMKEIEATSGNDSQPLDNKNGKDVIDIDPFDKLRSLLSKAIPKEISEKLLLAAAAEGQSKFYSKLEKKFLDFLKTVLLDLLIKCERKEIPSDIKRKILLFLSQNHIVLPNSIVVEISEKENILKASLETEKENYRIFIEENKKANNLSTLIDGFCRCFNSGHYDYSMRFKLEISSMIQCTITRLAENLKAGHFSSVVTTLGSTWGDWEIYQSHCIALSRDQKFQRITHNRYTSQYLRDNTCFQAMMKFSDSIIKNIRKFHADAYNIAVENPKVFTVLTEVSENVEALLAIRNTRAYTSFNTYCQPDRLDHLIEEIIIKFLAVFIYYSNAIEECLQAEEFPIKELAKLLDIYQHSHNLQNKLNQYSSGELASNIQSLRNFSPDYKSYEQIKNQVVTDAYVKLRSTFRQALLHHTELSTPNSIERDQYYKRLCLLYQNLSKSEILRSHVNALVIDLSTAEADCNTFLKSEINSIGDYLMNDLIDRLFGMRTVDVYGQFTVWYDNLRSFKVAFQGSSSSLSQSAAGRITEVDNYFAENLEILGNTAMIEKDNQNLIKKLLILKEMTVHIPFKKKIIDMKIDYILNNIINVEGFQRVINIGLLLNGKGQDPMAQMIIADHKVFEGILVLLFSTRVSRFTINHALDKKDGITGTDINNAKLKSQCDLFDFEYQSLVTSGLSRVSDAMKECVSESKIIAVNKSLYVVDRIRKLMVQLFAYWTLSHSEHYQQMVEASNNSDSSDNCRGSNSKNTDGIDADKRVYLMQPHVGQILAIFRMFGLDADSGGRVEIVHHFAQIYTGEGKSVVLAMVSTIFALMGFSVDCACYSEYLSRRDFLAFSNLFTDFGVSEYIVYGTFTDLCERFLNQTAGDIRESVQNLILKSTTDSRSSRALQRKQREKVVVIDEVDVFLNKHFFGNVYRPLAKVVDPTITALINRIWDSRNTFLNFRKVKTFPEYTSFITKFSQWQTLMEESIKTMLGDLKNADSHEPILVGDQIGYKDQDKISFDISYGYKTMFAHYKANAEGKISPARLQSKICLLIDCGSFSFAEIPKLYKYILGVSGTLETLSTPEKALLQDVYNIKKVTLVPSVYGGRKLDFTPNNGKDIKIESNNNFFNEITNEINYRKVSSSTPELNRPILVYFENSTVLMEYYRSVPLELRSKMKIVKEDVPTEMKESIIRQATAIGSITLLTQEFGRGVDFVVFDDRIDSLGGVHVIQTFMSEEESVQVQIKGRAGRQGCRGSYSMILSEGGLEKYMKNCEILEMRRTGTYIETLELKRKIFFEDKYQGTLNFIKEIKADHTLGMKFLADLTSLPMAKNNVKSFINDRNKSYYVESTRAISRTLILMDATGSMTSVITKTKATVKRMFTEALAVLAKQGMESAFEVQFAGYRNYNAPEAQLLEHSYWESDPDNLFTFIDSIDANYGLGNEAIEIGFWYANKEMPDSITDEYRYQVILIGDQPPNTESEVESKRKGNNGGEKYWSGTKFHQKVYYQSELDKLKAKNIPVHAFYVDEDAKPSFQQIARESGGQSSMLDINSPAGADMLTKLVTERILFEAAGGGAAGTAIISEYRKMFPKGYIRETDVRNI